MPISELLPILHALPHTEKLQAMQLLLRDIVNEEGIGIDVEEKPQARPIGLFKHVFSVPASFFEPLPDAVLDAFEGRDG